MEHGRAPKPSPGEPTGGAARSPLLDLARLQLLARALEQVGEAVAVFDVDDVLIYANTAFAQMNGQTAADLEGRHYTAMTGAEGGAADLAGEAKARRREDEASGVEVSRMEFTGRPSAAGTRTDQVTVSSLRDGAGLRIGRIVCVLDITERKALEAQLRQAGWRDPLTGLPNRLLLFERLDRALATAKRTHRPVAVLFIDLDTFKSVNDKHGHDVGDQLLVEVAKRLGACVRENDTLARLGGDEFVALLVDLGTNDDATATASRMLEAIGMPLVLDGITLSQSASIGVAVANVGRPRDVLHAADSAMYEAKMAGPGRVVLAASSARLPFADIASLRRPASR